ncbi:hypothetical protein [Planctomicrobium sp. SH527]|uniref:hypothetical protein n=1 Tax=Planctomicrobium sp. SH527 TaxID=3448123 RepID=UPI003F5B19A2
MEDHSQHNGSGTSSDESSDAPAKPRHPVSSHEARLSRVLDYQASSLEKKDPLEANLGSINSGLMRVALWLDETIERAMQSDSPNVERLSGILPVIETHLRVTRQVDRFAQIEVRAQEARRPKPNKDNHGVPRPYEGHRDQAQSEDSGI